MGMTDEDTSQKVDDARALLMQALALLDRAELAAPAAYVAHVIRLIDDHIAGD